MATLFTRFQNTQKGQGNIQRFAPEELMDTLFCLSYALEEGTLGQAGPESIELGEDGIVHLTSDAPNLYYASPEVIQGKGGDSKQSAWFSLGLLTYFVVTGRSYYEDQNLRVVDIPELTQKGTCLIPAPPDSQGKKDTPSLLAQAMAAFTSWNPENREAGMKPILMACRSYSAQADISYVCDGKEVHREKKDITAEKLIIDHHTTIKSAAGQVYLISESYEFPFRPGVHPYTVKVKPLIWRGHNPENDVLGKGKDKDNGGGDRDGGKDKKTPPAGSGKESFFLYVLDPPSKKRQEVMPLNQHGSAWYTTDVSKDKTLTFTLVVKNEAGQILRDERSYSLNLSAMPKVGTVAVKVFYLPIQGCGFSLYKTDKATSLSSGMQWFYF